MFQASLYGRIGRDIQVRQTKNDKRMAMTSIAVDATPYGVEDQETLWLNVTAFGKVAELLERHQKGDMVSVFGRITQSRYTKDGEEKTGLQITIDSLVSARTSRPSRKKKESAEPAAQGDFYNDDIPF